MQIGNLFVNICFPMQNGVIVLNGIFTTMAVIVIYLWWIENMRKAWREHRRGCAVLYALAMAALLLSIVPVQMLLPVSPLAVQLATIFVPSPVWCEGSVLIVLIGTVFITAGTASGRLRFFTRRFCVQCLRCSACFPSIGR